MNKELGLTLHVRREEDGWYWLWEDPNDGSAPNYDYSGPFATLEECWHWVNVVYKELTNGA